MFKKPVVKRIFVILLLLISISTSVYPWQHHPIFTKLVVETLPEVKNASSVPVEPLEQFLTEEGQSIAQVLANIESWAKENISMYAPCPPDLFFSSAGNTSEIKTKFFKSIRINPDTKTPLYVLGFASNPPEGKNLLDVKDICILKNTKEFEVFCFIKINPGESVSPVDVLASASNEPDYGMDTGLFSDNQTEFGAIYGFGVQPFGNPNLDFGSQAPFHMGFYHENPIITFFAPFLKQSYAEYRIYLYKELSKLAFKTGHDYWGWRFMGWGLHYLGDLSMPYHTTALPGYSALRMLWIYLLDILGWSTPKNNAVQLSSNRHLAIETLMGTLYINAVRDGEDPFYLLERYNYENNNKYNIFGYECPLYEGKIPTYSDDLPRKCLALRSHNWAGQLDRLISKVLPDRFVNDPSIELNNLEERDNILSLTLADQSFEVVRGLVDMANASLFLFNYYGKSYILDIVK